jgi:hypothetical protein
MEQEVPLSELNGAEAERMLEDLARPPRLLPARMKQPLPPPPPLPPAKPVDDPVQLRIEQLMASLDIEVAAVPAVVAPPPKPPAPPAPVLRPPSVAVSALSQAPTAAAAALRQPQVQPQGRPPQPQPQQPAAPGPCPNLEDSTELFCYAESLANGGSR